MLIFSKELLFAADDLHGVKEYTVPGVYTFTLSRRTRAKITQVGSGEDSWKAKYNNLMSSGTTTTYYSGYGGAVFIGGVILQAGRYTVTINESIEQTDPSAQSGSQILVPLPGSTIASTGNVILAHSSIGVLLTTGRYLTKNTNLEIDYGTVEMEANGNMNQSGTSSTAGAYLGGASLYNGYGKGANSRKHDNTSGYFKIEW